MSDSDNLPMERLISKLLKKQIAIQGLKNGFDLVPREIIKTLADAISDIVLVQEARKILVLAKKVAILKAGSERPVRKRYIKSFASFMTVNGRAP